MVVRVSTDPAQRPGCRGVFAPFYGLGNCQHPADLGQATAPGAVGQDAVAVHPQSDHQVSDRTRAAVFA